MLFQGDSVTEAFRRTNELSNAHQLGAGYALLIADRLLRGRPAELSPVQFVQDYRVLFQRSRNELPPLRFVLCEPFALPRGEVDEWWWKPLRERQRAVARLARQFDAVFVPLQSHFQAAAKRALARYSIYDGIHPTAAGDQLIADAWLRATPEPTRFLQQPVG